MEDASLLKAVRNDLAVFGVFDGHGSMPGFNHEIPELCAKEFARHLNPGTLRAQTGTAEHKVELEDMFIEIDQYSVKPHWRAKNVGSTAILAAVTPGNIYLANCGDSRAVVKLGSCGLVSTEDHKPSAEQERIRIEAAGGEVEDGYLSRKGSPGEVGCSRGFGDHRFKDPNLEAAEQMISCVPEVTVVPRGHSEPCFVLLGCDGVWDALSNEEAMAIVEQAMAAGRGIEAACSAVVQTALDRGSRDNISVIVVQVDSGEVSLLPGRPLPGTRLDHSLLAQVLDQRFALTATSSFSVIELAS